MASTVYPFLLIFFFLSIHKSQASFKPNAFVLPVQKHAELHIANIQMRTPLLPIPFLLDLNGRFLWVNCDQHYLSSTYRAPLCHSTLCARTGTQHCHKCSATAQPGCHNNTCGIITTNPMTHKSSTGELAQDILTIQSIHGSNLGPSAHFRSFIFACAPSTLLTEPLPRKVQGVVGLGHSPISMPLQLSSHFGFQPKFALCLSSSNKGNGVIFIGKTSYKFLDTSVPIKTYTPLTVSPQGEYYIQIRSISINNKPLPYNTSTKQDIIFTQISTTVPYTVLEPSLFSAFTKFFSNEVSLDVPRVNPPVSPFGLCFNTSTPVNPKVPDVEFVFYNPKASWSISATNLMYEARPGISCLAIMSGDWNSKAPIVLGLHQFEDNLLEFDLARSRLGFSTSLLSQKTSCASFNFTSSPTP